MERATPTMSGVHNAPNYRITNICCFVAIFVQAIITNVTAIIFIPLMELYNLTYAHLGILVAINFTAQVSADIFCSGVIDKLGFRKVILPTNAIAFVGLLLFALTPTLFPNNVFAGIVIATIIFAFASGLLEILISPIVAAIPGNDKGPAMSLMHSFYAWGQVATIIVTTLFLFVFGRNIWYVIVALWAIIPLVNFFMFLKAPMPPTVPEEHRQGYKAILFKPYYLLMLAAILLGGGSEVTINQWSSTFMEKALALPKVAGDLLGMCGFAVMLGVGRMLYGIFGNKINMHVVLIGGSAAAVICYIVVALSPIAGLSVAACAICGIAVSLLWPGTLVLASDAFPLAGAWMFAILAAAGDVGAAVSPFATGMIVDAANGGALSGLTAWLSQLLGVSGEQAAIRIGILCATVLPALCFVVHVAAKKKAAE